jgi:hypothetical protein
MKFNMKFSISKYINFPIFIASLAVGFFFVYVFDEKKKVIYVYPKPDNVDAIQYQDSTGTCFNMVQQKVKCGADISVIPPQN